MKRIRMPVSSSWICWRVWPRKTVPVVLSSWMISMNWEIHRREPQHVRILSERLPSGWCLVLTSRESPPFPLEVQENRAPVVSIGSRTLRLTPSEVVAWASELWGVELHVPDARSLWRATEGWPAALVMLGQHIHSGNLYRRQEDLRRLLRRGRRLREYLANQVLTQMSEQVVQVLRTASPLSKVVFPRDEKLFSGGISDAENTLTG